VGEQLLAQGSTHSLPALSPRQYGAYAENAPIPPSASYVDLPHSDRALTVSSQLPVEFPSANRLVPSNAIDKGPSAAISLNDNSVLCQYLSGF
jgi:hypothetical protein